MKKILHIFIKENKKLLRLLSNQTFVYLTLVGNGFLLLAVTAVYFLEKDQPQTQIHCFFDALWWGISTITTVAYGDILPQTFWGRIIGIVLMYTGTVLFISFTGVLLSTLLREEVEEEMAPLKKELRAEEREILERLKKLEKK